MDTNVAITITQCDNCWSDHGIGLKWIWWS